MSVSFFLLKSGMLKRTVKGKTDLVSLLFLCQCTYAGISTEDIRQVRKKTNKQKKHKNSWSVGRRWLTELLSWESWVGCDWSVGIRWRCQRKWSVMALINSGSLDLRKETLGLSAEHLTKPLVTSLIRYFLDFTYGWSQSWRFWMPLSCQTYSVMLWMSLGITVCMHQTK